MFTDDSEVDAGVEKHRSRANVNDIEIGAQMPIAKRSGLCLWTKGMRYN